MESRILKQPYLRVQTKQEIAYGGNQAWFPYKFLKKSGCGVIAAADVILHLQGKVQMTEAAYRKFAKKLWLSYLPVIPGFGMNGLTLMLGMNRYFAKKKLPYRACWKISARKMFRRIDEMLSKDIPVILAIGPNFPCIWAKHKLTFYTKTDKNYISSVKTCAHYVTVTGREGTYLQISSWGKEYYIDMMEYKEYVKRYSSPLVSNIVSIKRK